MEYNASVKIVYRDPVKMIFRVYPDGLKIKYLAGQYGALGLTFDSPRIDGLSGVVPSGNLSLIKRAYSVSSSIIDEKDEVILADDYPYYEFYIDLVSLDDSQKPRLSPRLFALKDGDRIFLGNKVVGHYHLKVRPPGSHVLLIASTTGEAPHNAMIAELLRSNEDVHICHVVVAEDEWSSAYCSTHERLTTMFPRYKYISLPNDKGYNGAHQFLKKCLSSLDESQSRLGWGILPENTCVYVCGDPQLIGAPVKLGGWQYEYPDYGLLRILEQAGFKPATRFQTGNVFHESYW